MVVLSVVRSTCRLPFTVTIHEHLTYTPTHTLVSTDIDSSVSTPFSYQSTDHRQLISSYE